MKLKDMIIRDLAIVRGDKKQEKRLLKELTYLHRKKDDLPPYNMRYRCEHKITNLDPIIERSLSMHCMGFRVKDLQRLLRRLGFKGYETTAVYRDAFNSLDESQRRKVFNEFKLQGYEVIKGIKATKVCSTDPDETTVFDVEAYREPIRLGHLALVISRWDRSTKGFKKKDFLPLKVNPGGHEKMVAGPCQTVSEFLAEDEAEHMLNRVGITDFSAY